MPLNIEFNNPEDELEKLKQNSQPPMQYDVSGDIENSIQETDFQPFQTPFQFPRNAPEDIHRAGFFEEFGHQFKTEELATKTISYLWDRYKDNPQDISDTEAHQNPLDNSVPKNWTPFDADKLAQYPDKFWPYLSSSENPNQYSMREREVERQMKEEEYYKDGSTWGWVLGGGAGIGIDLAVSMLIPMANSLKYASFYGATVKNMLRTAPYTATAGFAYSLAMDATEIDKTSSEKVEDAFINGLSGIALTGAAGGLGHFLRGGELYKLNKAGLKANLNDIEIVNSIDESGVIVGYQAKPINGANVSAAALDEAQKYADSQFARIGIFKIPGVGPGLEKALKYASPEFRGLTSPWKATNELINRLADTSIETVGVTKGITRPENFESLMDENRRASIHMTMRIDGYMHLANGIGGRGIIASTKRLKQRLTEGVMFDRQSWFDAVANRIVTGIPHEVSEVNQLAEEIEKFYDHYLHEWQKSMGYEEIDLPVKTAFGYMTRLYNVPEMITNRQRWRNMSLSWFDEGDRIISEATAPLERAKQLVDSLKQLIDSGVNVEENRIYLNLAKKERKAASEELRQQARENKNLQMLLNEQVTLSVEDEKALKSLLKPLNKSKKHMSTIKKKFNTQKSELENLIKKYETGESIIKKEGEQLKDYEKIKSDIEKLKPEVEKLEKEYQEAKDLRDREKFNLELQVTGGTIKRNMYTINPKTKAIEFKNPNKALSFRPLYNGDRNTMLTDADAVWGKITSTTPEKIANELLGTITGSINGHPLKERSFMIPDEYLLENNFLFKDLKRNLSLYAKTLGRSTNLNNSLKGFSVRAEGIHGVAEELVAQRELEEQKIMAQGLSKRKQDKALLKLNSSFKRETRFHTLLLKQAKGEYSYITENENVRRLSVATKAWVASTRLGNVPIAQLPDIAGNIIKMGPWRFIRDGLIPHITTINGLIKTDEGKALKRYACEAGLCLETVINSHADSMLNITEQYEMTIPGRVQGGLEYLAKLSGNLSGSNLEENFNQQFSASISQSRIMESMFKFKEGKLNARETRRLAQIGLDPHKWADTFIYEFKHGTSVKKKLGGYRTEYWNWKDKKAANAFGDAVRNNVNATIIRRGLFTSPLIANDPIISIFYNMTGWFFAAFNRYTVPMLQRPVDSYLFTGMLAQAALGALVDPFRVWSRGEEFDMDNDKWFMSAISNTAPFAFIYKAAMFANAITGDQFLKDMKNDRHRQISTLGAVGGAPVGLAQNLYEGTRMFASGKWNKADWKKNANSIPLTNMWYTNKFKNDFMDYATEGLPKNYERAEGYLE